jgi:DNA-binding SARP family transcriptional activator
MFEFRVLGPLEVLTNGSPLALGGVRQRSLLAILMLHTNEVVATDRLIDELWAQLPPPTALKTIQVYVSRFRKDLGDDRLLTRPPGYLLRIAPAELDLRQFEQLVDHARGAEPAAAARILRDALGLWRGPPLADLAYEPFAQIEIARLEELRWTALEQRIDADLAAGDHDELIGELQALVAGHPLRERLHGRLMLALYRAGRQAEALEAYNNARHRLVDELGLEPGVELRRLERAILEHDPALEQPPPAASPNGAAPPERSLLLAPAALDALPALLSLARPLAATEPPRVLVIAGVVDCDDLGSATAALGEHRAQLLAGGLAARTAAFSSPAPGRDIVRLASKEGADLLLMSAARSPLDGEAGVILERAPCDVAMFVEAGGPVREGPVIVPFGAAWHDWAALELGAWVARTTGAPLRLIGAASDHRENGRDASRLLADASLIVQRTAGVVAEPLLAAPGRKGVLGLARDAGLLIVGLSDRWREQGLGRVRAQLVEAPPAPTVLIRRGPRPGGLAPPETATRFGWSMTAGAA